MNKGIHINIWVFPVSWCTALYRFFIPAMTIVIFWADIGHGYVARIPFIFEVYGDE